MDLTHIISKRNKMTPLIIIYSPKIEKLLKYKVKATYWLPEQSIIKPPNDIYQPPNVICTTRQTTLKYLQMAIQANTINHLEVVWIIADKLSIAYTFDEKGHINNFFSC